MNILLIQALFCYIFHSFLRAFSQIDVSIGIQNCDIRSNSVLTVPIVSVSEGFPCRILRKYTQRNTVVGIMNVVCDMCGFWKIPSTSNGEDIPCFQFFIILGVWIPLSGKSFICDIDIDTICAVCIQDDTVCLVVRYMI